MAAFLRATDAFEYLFDNIMRNGEERNGTRALFNVGFYLLKPQDNTITTHWRKWRASYAKIEWDWYLSENRNVSELKKHASIWDKMHNGDNIVNSNYGWQWNRNSQLQNAIDILKRDRHSRRAYVTIYDGKEHADYEHDTPCTMYIGFLIQDNKLCMNVNMRSNDLVYGFCNDQFCFSRLQEMVANSLGLETGWYYHFTADMHIYERHYNLKPK